MLDLDLIWVAEVQNCLTELVAHLLKQIKIKVVVSELALIRPTETRLKRECIGDVEFFPQSNTCR